MKRIHEHAFWREFNTAPSVWPIVFVIVGLAVMWTLIISALVSVMAR